MPITGWQRSAGLSTYGIFYEHLRKRDAGLVFSNADAAFLQISVAAIDTQFALD